MENIIEYLIPLIIILAYIFPKARKKKPKQGQGQQIPAKSKEKKPGWFSKLNKMVEDYYDADKDEPGVSQQKTEVRDWQEEKYTYEDDNGESKSEPVYSKAAEEVPVVKRTVRKEVVSKKDSGALGHQLIPTPGTKLRYVSSKVSKRELRKAIVWAEILASPKALRDE